MTAETDEAVTASMVKELGMTNVVTSHLDGTTKDKTVPYSLETLTADNPDIIFVVTHGKEEEITKAMKQAMTDNPAWANLKAVQIIVSFTYHLNYSYLTQVYKHLRLWLV